MKTICLTWQNPSNEHRFTVGSLTQTQQGYHFAYVSGGDLDEARKLGFQGYPAFQNFDKEYTQNVIESFGSRLPPRSRADFQSILALWNIQNPAISDFDFLAVTGGALATDLFLFIDPHDEKAPTHFLSRVAGSVHHIDAPSAKKMKIGEELKLVPEDENKFDPQAVRIEHNGHRIGYLNKIHARRIRQAFKSGHRVAGQLNHLDANGVVNLVLTQVSITTPASA